MQCPLIHNMFFYIHSYLSKRLKRQDGILYTVHMGGMQDWPYRLNSFSQPCTFGVFWKSFFCAQLHMYVPGDNRVSQDSTLYLIDRLNLIEFLSFGKVASISYHSRNSQTFCGCKWSAGLYSITRVDILRQVSTQLGDGSLSRADKVLFFMRFK